MNLVAVGTAISFAKFIFLPHKTQEEAKPLKVGFWLGVLLLLGALVVANVVYYEAYNLPNIIKALAVIGVGWLAYWLIFRNTTIKLPRMFEQFDDLLGVITLISVLLFWVAVSSGWH